MGLEIAVFLGAVAVIAVVGVGIGMLVAPRLERLADDPDESDDPDEESGGHDRTDD
jgi:hypothetical protein